MDAAPSQRGELENHSGEGDQRGWSLTPRALKGALFEFPFHYFWLKKKCTSQEKHKNPSNKFLPFELSEL